MSQQLVAFLRFGDSTAMHQRPLTLFALPIQYGYGIIRKST